MTIGDVELSDDAKKYYDQLKSKFHNSEFILVSKDMKSQVQQNASAYGNANKMVVLIDEEKLERMATDESFRKKYEGIIAMPSSQMAAAKNSLASSGANIKNFGMSVDSNGNTSFFATLEKSSDAQAKRMEKKAEAKKEQKVKEKKKAEKEAKEERLEKAKEKHRAEKAEKTDDSDKAEETADVNDTEYIDIKANSLDDLLGKEISCEVLRGTGCQDPFPLFREKLRGKIHDQDQSVKSKERYRVESEEKGHRRIKKAACGKGGARPSDQ